MKRLLSIALLCSVPLSARAETITFSPDELARESVLPIFDRPDSVQNRTIVTARRLEVGGFGGWTMTDPFFNQISVGGELTYHINEVHGINLAGSTRLSGTSDYSSQLDTIRGVAPLHLQYAPAPKYLALAHYQYTAYYGKLSLTKQGVSHISLYGLIGGGMTGIGDGSYPTVSIGLGQKYYLSRSVALRFDLYELIYQGPDILSSSVNLSAKNEDQSASAFPKKTQFATMMTVGAVFMFPGF